MDQNPTDTMKALNSLLQQTENRTKGIHATFQDVNKAIVSYYSKSREESKVIFAQSVAAAEAAQHHIRYLREREAAGHRITDEQKEAAKAAVDSTDKELKKHRDLLSIAIKRDVYLKESLPTLAFVTAELDKTFKANSELNRSIIEANASFSSRYGILNSIYQIQKETGASLESVGDSARALVSYSQELNSNFRRNLAVVVMMRDGLGVSADHGAELVNLFERRLRIPARDVGDSIARIANNTALAADQAARFAIEIGRTLSLMGPGIGQQALRVNEVVLKMAGQMRELGGNAEDVLHLFQELGKGTPEGFQLRGFGQVNIGQLATGAGTQRALEGIGRLIDQIVSARPGTELYVAQLQAAATATRTNVEFIRYYNEALRKSNGPLNEAQQLEERYRNQMQESGKIVMQFKTSIAAFMHQALLPLFRLGTPILRFLADLLQKVIEFKPAVYAMTVALSTASIAAAVGLMRVVRALWAVAGTSAMISRGASLLGIPVGALQNVLQNVLKFTGLAAFTPTLISVGSRLIALLASPVKILSAFLAGWTVGRIIDNIMHRMGLDLSKTFQKFFTEKNQKHGIYTNGNLTIDAFGQYFRELGIRGTMLAPKQLADQLAVKLKSINGFDLSTVSPQRVAEAIERAVNTLAEGAKMREVSRTTELTAEDRAENEKLRIMIEHLKSSQSMNEILRLLHKTALLKQEQDRISNQETGTWKEFLDMLLNTGQPYKPMPMIPPGY